MVELVRAGRDPDDLAREFEPTGQSIRSWVAQADRNEGRREELIPGLARHDHFVQDDLQVRHRATECARREHHPFGPLRTAHWQGAVNEIVCDGAL